MLYSKRFDTGEPEIEVFGKPTASTFDYARSLLERRSEEIGLAGEVGKLKRIYMVGGETMGFDGFMMWFRRGST